MCAYVLDTQTHPLVQRVWSCQIPVELYRKPIDLQSILGNLRTQTAQDGTNGTFRKLGYLILGSL